MLEASTRARWGRSSVPQGGFDLGGKKLDVYFGSVFIPAPRLEVEELNHLGCSAAEISPEIFWSVLEVFRLEKTRFELRIANSGLLQLSNTSHSGIAANPPFVNRKICLT